MVLSGAEEARCPGGVSDVPCRESRGRVLFFSLAASASKGDFSCSLPRRAPAKSLSAGPSQATREGGLIMWSGKLHCVGVWRDGDTYQVYRIHIAPECRATLVGEVFWITQIDHRIVLIGFMTVAVSSCFRVPGFRTVQLCISLCSGRLYQGC